MPKETGMGEVIEDYQVLNLLGKGGFACVYRARSNKTGQEVAIKMIDKKLMKAANMVARVRKEVEIHSRLKHPAVLELYNYFEDSNYVYLVLEMCHNGEVQRYLKSNCKVLSEDEARLFMKNIVEGILYLHSHGILHRDLTLSNLLLTRDMDIKIADFGLATQLSVPDEKHFTMCGTPNYISPEVAMRSAHGLETDVWSLGCMLYTFLVGQPPFDTDGVKKTLNLVVTALYSVPDYLSPDAQDLIQCLLRKNPKDRISIRDIFSHSFMTKTSVLNKANSHKYSELSMDSGRGTMATVLSGRSAVSTRGKPFPAFPIRDVQSQISEDDERVLGSQWYTGSDTGSYTGYGTTSSQQRHPPSPPVRLRDSEKEAEMIFAKHRYEGSNNMGFPHSQVTNEHDVMRKTSQENIVDSVKTQNDYVLSNRLGGVHQFDPTRYQDHNSCTPSTSSLSCGNSFHSNSTGKFQSPAVPSEVSSGGDFVRTYLNNVSDHSSQDGQFSLQATKKVLTFDSKPGSLHEQEPVSANGHLGGNSNGNSVQYGGLSSHLRNIAGPIEFQSPYGHRVELSERDVVSCVKTSSSREYKNQQSKEKSAAVTELSAPLNCDRLRPIRQKTKNAVVNILESGEVCLEFVRHKGKQEKVIEVFSISSDGQHISIFQPNNGHGVLIADDPPSPGQGPLKTFTFGTMPEKYYKKYQYATRFVNLVRSKTPKVTIYTRRAKCMLMENSPDPDFEAVFYDGSKFTANSKGMRIIERNGTSLSLESQGAIDQHLSADTKEILEYVQDTRKQCFTLESVISKIQGSSGSKDQLFPVIVGRRPSSSLGDISKSSYTTSDTRSSSDPNDTKCSQMKPSTPMMSSFDGTVISNVTDCNSRAVSCMTSTQNTTLTSQVSTTTKSTSSDLSAGGSVVRKAASEVIQQMFVPNIGWASQHSNGEIWVKFNDGTQLGVKSTATTVTFMDHHGQTLRYHQSDILPNFVKVKLEKVPVVLEYLRTRASKMSMVSSSQS
ncbi:serine/threonine-protein kinase PLK4-like isoform X2 [Gigantopelta aegis]|uniref:serine/threonine-protein kinase PLK4-like isoform X2 n=1 Tax=Gigantopelta aegis TaxID=1735272 RepID=UPI001B88CEA0|nr:serine/threonine-protein kinase PLK4-like isoform X2 [Gigantopelta aegis]